MINLLSPIEKKKIQKEYHLRLGVVALSLVFILELVAVVLLVPAYHAVDTSTQSLEEDLAQRKAIEVPGGNEAQKELDLLKQEIGMLQSTTIPEALPSSVLREVLKVKPVGIDVTAFAYGKVDNTALVQVGGNARSREDLLFFQRSLKSNPRFDEVRYADSFITKKTDINFQLTLKIK